MNYFMKIFNCKDGIGKRVISFTLVIMIGLVVFPCDVFAATNGGDNKLKVVMSSEEGYLYGDSGELNVKLTKNGYLYNISFGSYSSNPSIISQLPKNQDEFSFADDSTSKKSYSFKISNELEQIVGATGNEIAITGRYKYGFLNKGEGDVIHNIGIRKGQIKVKVVDESDNNITSPQTTAVIKNSNIQGVYNEAEGCIVFEYVPSGQYEVEIKNFDGQIIGETLKMTSKPLSYGNSTEEIEFVGRINKDDSGLPVIRVDSATAMSNEDGDITVTYNIIPEGFKLSKSDLGDTYQVSKAKIFITPGNDFEIISGLNDEGNGKHSIDLGEIIYAKDSSGQYTSNNFSKSFVAKSVVQKEKLLFEEAYIFYEDLKGNPIQEDIPMPDIETTIQRGRINILEIQPADSFKVTLEEGYITTGTEEKDLIIDNKQVSVKVDHITMPEFVGRLESLKDTYDIIVLGNYKDTVNITEDNETTRSQVRYQNYWPIENSTSPVNNSIKPYKNIGNDIGDRKIKELKRFIDSKQLFYVDKSLKNINKDTKIYKNFNEYVGSNRQNVISYDSIDLNTVVSEYLKVDNKYKGYEISVEPLNSDTMEIEKGNIVNRNMKFNLSIMNKSGSIEPEVVDIKLYLDINGDGLFKNDEVVEYIEGIKVPTAKYEFTYQLAEDFIGYLDWKIEVIKQESPNQQEKISSSYTDGLLFRRLHDKKVINVLEISPYTGNDLSPASNVHNKNLNLKTNQDFQNLIKELKDYEINIEVMAVKDFNSKVNSLQLNERYNMLILGFGDDYDRTDSNGLTNQSILAIKNFAKTGQSVMLTHDTLNVNKLGNNSVKKDFIEVVGQKSDVKTIGGWDNSKEMQTKRVNQINNALITEYPFKLEEEIPVRRTHKQWSQLDLDKEQELIVWYTMKSNTVTPNGSIEDSNESDVVSDNKNNLADTSYMNPYDVRNSYYTYSIGNITFSGTGENTWEENSPYPTSELKLFVNTIVKAERSANHAPTIKITNVGETEDEPKVISKDSQEFSFSVRVDDLDKDDVNGDIIISVYDGVKWIKIPNSIEEFSNPSGVITNITLKNSDYAKYKKLRVTVNAYDREGAAAIPKVGYVEISDLPLLEVNLVPDKDGYLFGDEVRLQSVVKSTSKKIVYSNILMNLKNLEGNDAITLLSSSNSLSFDDINNQITSRSGEYRLGINYGETNIIDADYSYKLDGSNIRGKVNITLPAKQGRIKINVKDSNGNKVAEDIPFKLMKDGNIVYEGVVASSLQGSLDINTILTTGTYTVEIGNVDGYELSEEIKNESINLNYINNSDEFNVVLIPKVDGLQHGLYMGVDSNPIIKSNDINAYEEKIPFEILSGSKVSFGADFKIKSAATITLQVDSSLKTEVDKIKFYKVLKEDGRNTLKAIENATISQSNTLKNTYTISIKNITNETEVLVIYEGEVPSESSDVKYENTITVNGIRENVIIKTPEVNEGKSKLPNLF